MASIVHRKPWRFVVFALRIAAAAAAGVTAIVMATSHKTTTVFGLQVQAKFQYMTSFVFFVAANVVACAYSLLAILVPPASPAARHVLVADAVLGMVLTGASGCTRGGKWLPAKQQSGSQLSRRRPQLPAY